MQAARPIKACLSVMVLRGCACADGGAAAAHAILVQLPLAAVHVQRRPCLVSLRQLRQAFELTVEILICIVLGPVPSLKSSCALLAGHLRRPSQHQ